MGWMDVLPSCLFVHCICAWWGQRPGKDILELEFKNGCERLQGPGFIPQLWKKREKKKRISHYNYLQNTDTFQI